MDYSHWLRNKKKYYRRLPIIAGTTLVFSTLLMPNIPLKITGVYLKNLLEWFSFEPNYRIVGLVIQTIFILFVLFTMQGKYYPIGEGNGEKLRDYIIKKFGTKSQLSKKTGTYLEDGFNKNLRQFYHLWQGVWILWFVLYLVLCIDAYLSLMYKTVSFHWLEVIVDVLNIGSSLLIVFMYRILSKKTVKRSANGTAKNDLFTGRIILIFIALVIFDILLHTFKGALFDTKPSTSFIQLKFIIKFLIGIFATVSFASLLGKLNSPFFNIPPISILTLYLYVAIQMLSPFDKDVISENFSDHRDIIMTIMTSAAFIFKIIFFFTLSWIMETGKLTYFLICESNLVREEEENFNTFQSIKLSNEEESN